jgi:hypothetical protein
MLRKRFIGILAAALVVAALAVAWVAAPRTPAARASAGPQVVFSGQGNGVGFWIWCELPNDNLYANLKPCEGSMQFDNLGIHTAVLTGNAIQHTSGTYTMHVLGSNPSGSVNCMLVGTDQPTPGPTNSVSVTCTQPAGFSAVVDNVVIVVTRASGS